jgi:hypothetical protein
VKRFTGEDINNTEADICKETEIQGKSDTGIERSMAKRDTGDATREDGFEEKCRDTGENN